MFLLLCILKMYCQTIEQALSDLFRNPEMKNLLKNIEQKLSVSHLTAENNITKSNIHRDNNLKNSFLMNKMFNDSFAKENEEDDSIFQKLFSFLGSDNNPPIKEQKSSNFDQSVNETEFSGNKKEDEKQVDFSNKRKKTEKYFITNNDEKEQDIVENNKLSENEESKSSSNTDEKKKMKKKDTEELESKEGKTRNTKHAQDHSEEDSKDFDHDNEKNKNHHHDEHRNEKHANRNHTDHGNKKQGKHKYDDERTEEHHNNMLNEEHNSDYTQDDNNVVKNNIQLIAEKDDKEDANDSVNNEDDNHKDDRKTQIAEQHEEEINETINESGEKNEKQNLNELDSSDKSVGKDQNEKEFFVESNLQNKEDTLEKNNSDSNKNEDDLQLKNNTKQKGIKNETINKSTQDSVQNSLNKIGKEKVLETKNSNLSQNNNEDQSNKSTDEENSIQDKKSLKNITHEESKNLTQKLKSLITSIKSMNEKSEKPNKILISFDPKGNKISVKIMPQTMANEEDKKLITGSAKLLSLFEKNVTILKSLFPKENYGRIKDVLIYKEKNGDIEEYWGKIKFHKTKNGDYMDESGFLVGKLVDKFEDITEEGILTETGFFQSKKLSQKDLDESLDSMKNLIVEIAKIQNKRVSELMEEEEMLTSLDNLIFRNNYSIPTHGVNGCKYICICKNIECKDGCEKVLCVSEKVIEKMLAN